MFSFIYSALVIRIVRESSLESPTTAISVKRINVRNASLAVSCSTGRRLRRSPASPGRLAAPGTRSIADNVCQGQWILNRLRIQSCQPVTVNANCWFNDHYNCCVILRRNVWQVWKHGCAFFCLEFLNLEVSLEIWKFLRLSYVNFAYWFLYRKSGLHRRI